MSVSALSWKSLPVYTPDTNIATGANLIAGIKSALQQTVYVDGTARTPGSNVAWSATSLADGSLKCEPVGNALGMLVHFVATAQTSASTPMSFGEVRPALGERVFSTVVLNPGSYTSASATPWGTDAATRVFGYAHASPAASAVSGANNGMNANSGTTHLVRSIRVYESKDALLILLEAVVAAGVSAYGAYAMLPLLFGGFVAPVTSDAADAESGGLLYGMCTHGGTGNAGQYFYSYNTAFYSNTAFLGHSANGACSAANGVSGTHAGIFTPGSSTVRTFSISSRFLNGLTTLNNKLVKMPIYIGNSTNIFGRVREITVYKAGLVGTLLRSEGLDKGHIVGMAPSATTDSVLLSM